MPIPRPALVAATRYRVTATRARVVLQPPDALIDFAWSTRHADTPSDHRNPITATPPTAARLSTGHAGDGHASAAGRAPYRHRRPRPVPGRAQLRDLLGKLAAGCHSPLEIWGHDLDVYAEPQRVAFELDGASVHGAPGQREVDLRRDAWLATLGIQVVRFSHRRLVHDIAEVRREILAVLATRR